MTTLLRPQFDVVFSSSDWHHFREMVETASEREFEPEYVVFDSWYSGLDNLKKIRGLGWRFFTRP